MPAVLNTASYKCISFTRSMQTFDIDRVDWEKLSTSAINSPVSEFDDDDFDGDDDDSDDEDM